MSLILDGTNGLSDVDGTAGTPAIRGSDANTGVFFGTDIVGVSTGGSERVRVDASGNVGIGTSLPTARLNIASGTNEGAVRVGDNATFYGEFARVQATDEVRIGSYGASQNLTFYTVSSERARIDSSGQFFVGTTSNPGGGTSVAAFSGADVLNVNNTVAGTGSATSVYFKRNATTVGTIAVTGSATAYNTSSDYRLKENIQPMTGALAKVAALKPCTYNWKSDGSDGQGFIAHELQEVCPDAVTGEKDAVETYTDENGVEQTRIKPQGIDTSFLAGLYAAALQELKAINDAQAQTIESLTARVVALEQA